MGTRQNTNDPLAEFTSGSPVGAPDALSEFGTKKQLAETVHLQEPESPVNKVLFSARSAAEGATLGASEPVISAIKAGFDSHFNNKNFGTAYNEDVAQRIKEKQQNPNLDIASQIGGALIPTPFSPVNAVLRGAKGMSEAVAIGKGLLPTLGRAAVEGVVSGGTAEAIKQATERPSGFKTGGSAAGEIGETSLISGVLGPMGALAGKAVQGAVQSTVGQRLLKPNSEEILKAGELLKVTPTPGMLSASKAVQDLESSLYQTPHYGASGVKASVQEATAATKQAAESLFSQATGLTHTEVGTDVRKSLVNQIQKKLEPAELIYNSLEDKLKQTPSVIESSNNIIVELKQRAALDGSGQIAKIANSNSIALENVQTVHDLKVFRTGIGQQLKSSNLEPMERGALNALYKAASEDRSASIILNSYEVGIDPIEVTKQLEKADNIYKQTFHDLESSLPFNKIGSIDRLSSQIENIPAQKVPGKFFNMGDVEGTKNFGTVFPQEYEKLRQSRLSDIIQKSQTKGEVSPQKVISNIGRLEPEAKTMLFGQDGATKIDALKTLLNSIPERVGPSGTPHGMEMNGFIIKAISMLGPLETMGKSAYYKLLSDAAYGQGISTAIQKPFLVTPPAIDNAINRRFETKRKQ